MTTDSSGRADVPSRVCGDRFTTADSIRGMGVQDSSSLTRVLVIDDLGLVREGLTELLGRMPGIEPVGAAATATEGIETAAASRPDVVLVGSHLTDMDRVEALPRLAAANPAGKIILLSQSAWSVSRGTVETGAQGIVAKASGYSTLYEAIQVVTAGHVFVDPAAHANAGLTTRELEVMGHLACGLTTKEIAATCELSVWTIQTYIERAMHKLGASNRGAAIALAVRKGLV